MDMAFSAARIRADSTWPSAMAPCRRCRMTLILRFIGDRETVSMAISLIKFINDLPPHAAMSVYLSAAS